MTHTHTHLYIKTHAYAHSSACRQPADTTPVEKHFGVWRHILHRGVPHTHTHTHSTYMFHTQVIPTHTFYMHVPHTGVTQTHTRSTH
ncbi:hypothetical protein LDENG_00275070, partial [Lucifuga dentata]